jgi:hypothetical protein
MNHDRRAADGFRTRGPHLGILVRQHDAAAAESQLRVADFTGRIIHPHHLGGPENLLVEIDRLGGIPDGQLRSGFQASGGNERDLIYHEGDIACHGGPPRLNDDRLVFENPSDHTGDERSHLTITAPEGDQG